MSRLHRVFGRHTANLIRSTEGSALPLVGLAAFMLIAATGSAIDMARVQVVRSRMQTALDAAGLAVGSTINTVDVTTETQKYFYANYPNGYMGSTITTLLATPAQDNNLINLSASAIVPMTFMQVVGIDNVTVTTTSQIIRQSKGMELVLVIDNTGSMSNSAGGSVSKISAAKTAARTLLDTLYGVDNDTVPNLWVSLVPFSQAVNVGTEHADWTENTIFDWGVTSWHGCVDARPSTYDTSDDPPSERLFAKYYWPCDSNNQWFGTNTSRTNCYTGSKMKYRSSPSTSNYGPNKYCVEPLVPLVAEKSTVVSGINAMTANGQTHIGIGAVWAWRLLSPRWRGLWGGQMDAEGLPLDYDTPLMSKVMVLMSDGDNTLMNSMRGAYWYLSDGILGTTNSSTAENRLDDRTKDVCDAMKSHGIIIYTVALGANVSSSGKALLQNCATTADYYFLSPTTDELEAIFKQIGDSLANLRVAQ